MMEDPMKFFNIQRALIYTFFICFIFFTLVYCDNVAHDIAFPEEEIINSHIQSLSVIEQPEETGVIRLGLAEDQTVLPQVPSHNHTCIIYKYRAMISFNENTCLRPDSPAIWPGSLIAGHTVLSGDYAPVTARRRSARITIFSRNGEYGETISNPGYGNVSSAIGNYYATTKSTTPAIKVRHRMENVHSLDQLKIVLSTHLPTYEFEETPFIDEIFDFDSTDVITRKAVEFTSIYYTVNFSSPNNPSDLFDPSVTWDELESQIADNISPVYVSSVQYGKTALFFIESPFDDEELTAALNYAIDDICLGEEIDKERYRFIVDNSTIKVYRNGSSPEPEILVLSGFEDLQLYTSQARETDSEACCHPLTYSLQYVKDNTDARILLCADYFKRECEDLPFKLTIFSRLEGGEPLIRECEVRSTSYINLLSTPSYNRLFSEYSFARWEQLEGYSWIVNPDICDTYATEFINDCTIVADYSMFLTPSPSPITTTPPDTDTPTPNTPTPTPNTPTPTPNTPTPTPNTPTPTPTPNTPTPTPGPFTCSVTYLNDDGESVTDTYTNLFYSSSINISAPCSIVMGNPPYGTTLEFVQWHSNGNATISSPASCGGASVTNFIGNTNIGASY
jgi:hypothetical protein